MHTQPEVVAESCGMRSMRLKRELGIMQDLSQLTNKLLREACLPKPFNWFKLIRVTIQVVAMIFFYLE